MPTAAFKWPNLSALTKIIKPVHGWNYCWWIRFSVCFAVHNPTKLPRHSSSYGHGILFLTEESAKREERGFVKAPSIMEEVAFFASLPPTGPQGGPKGRGPCIVRRPSTCGSPNLDSGLSCRLDRLQKKSWEHSWPREMGRIRSPARLKRKSSRWLHRNFSSWHFCA